MTARAVLGLCVVVFLLAAATSHWAIVTRYPHSKMQAAIERIGQSGDRHNVFVHANPVTADSRGVVRPSPDLLYSVCIYDLSQGDIEIVMNPQESYHSLSLYDDQTNNFFVVNDQETGSTGFRLRLLSSPFDKEVTDGNDQMLRPPGEIGLALIRRLAATPDQLEMAQIVRENDRCGTIDG